MSHPLIDRLRGSGYAGASPIDLLAAGLARREEDVSEEMAREFLRKLGRIQMLTEVSPSELREMTGLEGFELVRTQALIEIGRRAGGAGKGWRREMSDPDAVAEVFDYLRGEKKEHFCIALLDTKNFLIKAATIHIGSLDHSYVGAREVFREAIREGAASLICVHNHPSGDPTPSQADIESTNRLAKIGGMLEIPVLDHVIIGERRSVSLRRLGLFEHGL